MNRLSLIKNRTQILYHFFKVLGNDASYLRNQSYQGYIPLIENESQATVRGQTAGMEPDADNLPVDPAQVAALEQLLDELQKDGIKVILVQTPEHLPSYARQMDEIRGKTALLKSIAQRRGVPFLDYLLEKQTNLNRGENFYFNKNHLNALGSRVFTWALRQDLARYIPEKKRGLADHEILMVQADYVRGMEGDLQGIPYLKKAIEADPSRYEAYAELGIIYFNAGRDAEALKMMKKAVELQPNFTALQVGLGNIYGQMKQYDQAIFCYQNAQRLSPALPHVYYNLGTVFYLKRNFSEAETNLKKAVKLDPGNVTYNYNLGIVYYESGQYQNALIYLSFSAKHDPKNSDVLAALGACQLQLKDYVSAMGSLQKALELNPNHVAALKQMGILGEETNQLKLAGQARARLAYLESKRR